MQEHNPAAIRNLDALASKSPLGHFWGHFRNVALAALRMSEQAPARPACLPKAGIVGFADAERA